MKKWQIENSEKSEISEILEKLFWVFWFPSFRFCPTAKIENSDLKILEKNFWDFRDFRGFRIFDLADKLSTFPTDFVFSRKLTETHSTHIGY